MRRGSSAFLAVVPIILGSLCASELAAQTDPPKTIDLEYLRTPTSPALSLLGVNPAVIARPSTPRALATELVSSGRAGIIPNNYAIEVAPYWLTPRPTLTYASYIGPTMGQSLRETFTLSAATAHADSGTDSSVTRVAFGARTIPLRGRPSARFNALSKAFVSLQDARLDSLDKYLNARTKADSIRLVASLDKQADSLRVLARSMGAQEPVGVFWEVASAGSFDIPDASFDAGRVGQIAAWTTFSYRLDAPRLEIITLARGLRDRRSGAQNAFDAGARFQATIGDLGISSEFVNRTAYGGYNAASPLRSSTRAVGMVDYRASDDLYLTMSFGRDYALPNARHPLITRIGVQLGYGNKPAIRAPNG